MATLISKIPPPPPQKEKNGPGGEKKIYTVIKALNEQKQEKRKLNCPRLEILQ